MSRSSAESISALLTGSYIEKGEARQWRMRTENKRTKKNGLVGELRFCFRREKKNKKVKSGE